MKTHIIEDGIVINTVLATVAEAQAAFPEETCIDGSVGGIGWTWDGVTLAAPDPEPAPIPQVVSMRQARLALLAAGLLPTVTAAVAAADAVAQIEWEYAQEVRRYWPTLLALQGAVGLSDAQLDALFVAAAAL